LPCGQGTHWDSGCFHKVEGLWFRSHFPFFDIYVIGPAPAERWITVNLIADFELSDVCTRFLHDTGNIVSRDQRQVCAEFLRVLSAECERIGWIDAAGDHAHERFIVVRLWSLHLFNLEHIRLAVFMGDDGSHLWLFISARCADR